MPSAGAADGGEEFVEEGVVDDADGGVAGEEEGEGDGDGGEVVDEVGGAVDGVDEEGGAGGDAARGVVAFLADEVVGGVFGDEARGD